MATPLEQVILFTGVSEERAREALDANNGNVLQTVDALSQPPQTSGAKYIPPPPTIDDGLTDEVRDKLRDARKLADLLTFSPKNDLRGKAAHYPERSSAASGSVPQLQSVASSESSGQTESHSLPLSAQ